MFDEIDPRSAVPLESQLASSVRRAIAEGELASGDPLPSARELASRLRINPAAISGAYAKLAREGYIEVRRGAGTFISRVIPGSPSAHPLRAALAASLGAPLLTPGRLIGSRYEIQEFLGRGGMGVVYRAFDRELRESIAIKVLLPALVGIDRISLERFKQEIRLARRISQRNVLRTHDLGEIDGTYFITMEYAPGATLAAMIAERGRLSVEATLSVGSQLCRALAAAHREGIVHRDIKPHNLMMDAAGVLKVMDFGLARLAEEAPRPDHGLTQGLTISGQLLGTPAYMSPEQLLSESLDGRSDLYAVGAVLFECLTGQRVFAATKLTALIAAHLQESPPDPRTLNDEIPAALAAVILTALAKSREDRFADADDDADGARSGDLGGAADDRDAPSVPRVDRSEREY